MRAQVRPTQVVGVWLREMALFSLCFVLSSSSSRLHASSWSCRKTPSSDVSLIEFFAPSASCMRLLVADGVVGRDARLLLV